MIAEPGLVIREATVYDIPQIQVIRNSVNENKLSNPALVTDLHCETYLTQRGKGWVGVTNGAITGFSIVDLLENNIWALFVNPDFEKQGIGRGLHDMMLKWYFSQTKITVWLGTSPGTRAEAFYRKAGWTEKGKHGENEIRFEMSYPDWQTISIRQ